MFKELNRGKKTVREGIDTKTMDFAPLKNFCGTTVKVDGFFFTDSKFGKQVVLVGNGFLINMPARAVEQFEKIANDEKLLNGVLEGHLCLVNICIVDTKNGTTTGYDLEDC